MNRKPSLLSPSTVLAPLLSIITAEAAEATAAPTAEETAEETEEETPVPEGDFKCEGEMGIRNKGVCCAVGACFVVALGQLVFVFWSAHGSN